jgi:hypothetical protein
MTIRSPVAAAVDAFRATLTVRAPDIPRTARIMREASAGRAGVMAEPAGPTLPDGDGLFLGLLRAEIAADETAVRDLVGDRDLLDVVRLLTERLVKVYAVVCGGRDRLDSVLTSLQRGEVTTVQRRQAKPLPKATAYALYRARWAGDRRGCRALVTDADRLMLAEDLVDLGLAFAEVALGEDQVDDWFLGRLQQLAQAEAGGELS